MEKMIRMVSRAAFPSAFGPFTIFGFEETVTGEPYVVLTCGELGAGRAPLLRIHSQCLTGDVLGSSRCDCGFQLHESMRLVQEDGCGLLIYQLREGRGIGILNKLKAYELQDQGLDTVEANQSLGFSADLRDYDGCVAILRFFKIHEVRLLSNNPDKIAGLENNGIRVAARIAIEMPPEESSRHYLRTKKEKLGHFLHGV